MGGISQGNVNFSFGLKVMGLGLRGLTPLLSLRENLAGFSPPYQPFSRYSGAFAATGLSSKLPLNKGEPLGIFYGSSCQWDLRKPAPAASGLTS